MATQASLDNPPQVPSQTSSTGRGFPTGLAVLTGFTGVMLLAASYMVFVYAPMERTLGNVQRIFYFHVASAWAGALAFLVALVAGIVFLINGKMQWDRVGKSSVEVGLMLLTITLTSGPIWGQYAWGNPWPAWDPKLTSAAVTWLSYAAYLMLRQGIDDPRRRARFAAIYVIIAFTSVIFTYVGVRFVEQTIHPHVVGPSASTGEGDFGVSARIGQTLGFSLLTFTAVYATLLAHRLRLENLSERIKQVKSAVLARQG
ncbi:MAG: cytochrome c biogenesis protein CcsA [Chloroflexi bacterium]|nr:cytochrome c biogenesis protein CcsA [Chloroflexota bacterium]